VGSPNRAKVPGGDRSLCCYLLPSFINVLPVFFIVLNQNIVAPPSSVPALSSLPCYSVFHGQDDLLLQRLWFMSFSVGN